MTDYMYNNFYDIMPGMKINVAHMKQSRSEGCNNGKSPLSLSAYKNIYVRSLFRLKKWSIYICIVFYFRVVSYGLG